MKSIVKVLLSMLAVVLISQCENDEPNPVVTIPDDNFLSALIDLGVDANGDGIISSKEAKAIIILDVNRRNITDMTGIEAFLNLQNLNCELNQLTALDVTNNTALTWLELNHMLSLNKVCVWEMPFPPDAVYVEMINSPNLYFTTDCSGGD